MEGSGSADGKEGGAGALGRMTGLQLKPVRTSERLTGIGESPYFSVPSPSFIWGFCGHRGVLLAHDILRVLATRALEVLVLL